MPVHSPTRRTLLAGGVAGSALGGLALGPAGAAVSVPVGSSVDVFLDLDGIPGDSDDAEFPHTFEILDWHLGATTSVGPETSGGARRKVKPQPLTVVKLLDQASPKLFLACATGKHIAKATLVARKASAKQPYLKVVLKDVYVSSYRSAPNSDGALPLDVVGLDYATLEIDYTVESPAGGIDKVVRAAFDFVRNRVL